jgi:hypothetical protein
MEKPTLADKMSRASLSRNERVIEKKKNHPAVSAAKKLYDRLHGKRRK